MRVIDLGMRIKRSVMKKQQITHPFEKDLSFLYGTIFTGRSFNAERHSRNVCVFADGEVDRHRRAGLARRELVRGEEGLDDGQVDLGELPVFAPYQLRATFEGLAASDAEVRVVEYLKANVTPGERVVVSTLVNEVFTDPEEREVLSRLFAAVGVAIGATQITSAG